MKTITIKEFADNIDLYTQGTLRAYLPTFNGDKLVTRLNNMFGYPSAYCARDNGGFGMSYAVHWGSCLVVK